MKLLKKYLAAITGEAFTFVGLLIAYWTLDGSAKKATGFASLMGFCLWLISIPLNDDTPDDE